MQTMPRQFGVDRTFTVLPRISILLVTNTWSAKLLWRKRIQMYVSPKCFPLILFCYELLLLSYFNQFFFFWAKVCV
jgi:hypothetical protein